MADWRPRKSRVIRRRFISKPNSKNVLKYSDFERNNIPQESDRYIQQTKPRTQARPPSANTSSVQTTRDATAESATRLPWELQYQQISGEEVRATVQEAEKLVDYLQHRRVKTEEKLKMLLNALQQMVEEEVERAATRCQQSDGEYFCNLQQLLARYEVELDMAKIMECKYESLLSKLRKEMLWYPTRQKELETIFAVQQKVVMRLIGLSSAQQRQTSPRHSHFKSRTNCQAERPREQTEEIGVERPRELTEETEVERPREQREETEVERLREQKSISREAAASSTADDLDQGDVGREQPEPVSSHCRYTTLDRDWSRRREVMAGGGKQCKELLNQLKTVFRVTKVEQVADRYLAEKQQLKFLENQLKKTSEKRAALFTEKEMLMEELKNLRELVHNTQTGNTESSQVIAEDLEGVVKNLATEQQPQQMHNIILQIQRGLEALLDKMAAVGMTKDKERPMTNSAEATLARCGMEIKHLLLTTCSRHSKQEQKSQSCQHLMNYARDKENPGRDITVIEA